MSPARLSPDQFTKMWKRAMSTFERRGEMLRELAEENPRPEEMWREEEDFDPRFLRGTLSDAERKGLIEIDRTTPGNWRIRFTETGRDVEAATRLISQGDRS